MYTVLSYGQMVADAVRVDAYAGAIARVVHPGSIVVDLGCGTGILSLLALRAGALRVHAVDTNPAVWLARDLARDNGFGDRLRVHHRSSFEVDLGERADVIVTDLRGSTPFFSENLAAVADARRRWLAPGGTLIPARDRMFVALVETETQWRILEHGWTSLERRGFTADAARSATLNCAYTDADAPLGAEQILSEAKAWAEIDYRDAATQAPSRTSSGDVELAMTRGGTAHALAVWFEATLHDDIGFTNAPGQRLVYKRTVLPLLEPVPVTAREIAKVTLRADASGASWAWETEIGKRAHVRQASFLGTPTDPESLLRESPAATPVLSSRGERAREVLDAMSGNHTLREIGEALKKAHPEVRGETIDDEIKSCARQFAH